MDYATRYPEAVPLKNIDTETVAEALLDMYSRLGVPEVLRTLEPSVYRLHEGVSDFFPSRG